MRALSVHQPWAYAIAAGVKTIESRRRPTQIRGDILIVSTKRRAPADSTGDRYLYGYALCIVELYDCQVLGPHDFIRALVPPEPGLYGWQFRRIRPVHVFPVRGRQGWYHVDDALIRPGHFDIDPLLINYGVYDEVIYGQRSI